MNQTQRTIIFQRIDIKGERGRGEKKSREKKKSREEEQRKKEKTKVGKRKEKMSSGAIT